MDKLIAATHGRDAARAYRSYVLQPHQRDRAGEIGQDVLRYFARVAGACTGLSAVYATALRGIASLPAYVVAGSLSADGARVFGNDKPVDGKRDFADSNLSWDGHVWVMIGDYVADISIGWTARFGGPSALTTTVAREFGPTAGLLIVKWRDAPLSGLVYSPQYVLSDEQVATLDSSALAAFEKA
ncbi:hypothetical protein [Sphingomonas sp. PP-CC-3G-468]|uniref:hypothetical protein n=1 Tax=Sphingomonas sp. PP-CC-3G-468 TaxID=2135656 RepID=UPI0010527561|nr:hypothetical protein [Sphingomonas sp. PP-CC-3G-468]